MSSCFENMIFLKSGPSFVLTLNEFDHFKNIQVALQCDVNSRYRAEFFSYNSFLSYARLHKYTRTHRYIFTNGVITKNMLFGYTRTC